MRFKNTLVRALLLIAFCGRLAGSPALQAQDKVGKAFSDFSCRDLMVVIAGSSGAVTNVNCRHGYYLNTLPDGGRIAPGKPAVLLFVQSEVYGPDCTIQVTQGNRTAVLSVQQNFCSLEAGSITASVKSGPATFNTQAEGAYSGNLPGTVWFNVNF
jgi:hypothetical protein